MFDCSSVIPVDFDIVLEFWSLELNFVNHCLAASKSASSSLCERDEYALCNEAN
jgi:hypothetical protein